MANNHDLVALKKYVLCELPAPSLQNLSKRSGRAKSSSTNRTTVVQWSGEAVYTVVVGVHSVSNALLQQADITDFGAPFFNSSQFVLSI